MAKALVLRTCNADMTAYGGFQWPCSGLVEAPDWNPEPVCGGGLHGLLWGEGSASYLNSSPDAKWLVVEVEESEAVWINGNKVKFPRCEVLFAGTREEAVGRIQTHPAAQGKAIVYSTLTAGVGSTLTAGDGSTLTAGDRSTLTAGDGSTLTGGYGSTLIILRWNGKKYKAHVAEVWECGIEPNVAYKLDDKGNFVKA